MIKKVAFLEGQLLSSQSEQSEKFLKSGFFGGPAFIQPIKAMQSEKFSKSPDWMEKSRPSKKATFALIM